MMLIFLLLQLSFELLSSKILQGKYSNHITDYELVLPRKVKSNGAFDSFDLQHFFNDEKKGDIYKSNDAVFYKIPIDEKQHVLKLLPNRDIVSSGMLIESHLDGKNVSAISLKEPSKHLCLYHGQVVGDPTSRAALSLCDGIAGHIKVNNSLYYIEPIRNENALKTGEHVHVIYKKTLGSNKNRCYDTRGDWWNSWAEELYTAKMKKALQRKVIKSKREEDFQGDNHSSRYLEVCVVPDSHFLQYHQDKNVEEYLLTIMNMVSDLWHDASIGQEINIVVVRMIYLLKEMKGFDLNIIDNSEEALYNFCKWQSLLNPPDDDHPHHYDLAILFTRLELSALDRGSNSFQGIAFEASACNPLGKNCAIVNDEGLVTGVIAAHEIGHTMGCAHDSPEIGCSGMMPDGTWTIMSPTIRLTSHAWSECSREFVANYFGSGLGDCMLDQPKGHSYTLVESLPGTIYDFDAQCRMIFGHEFMGCPMGGDDICKILWCKQGTDSSCFSRGEPVVDGTICGTNKWCYHGECIEEGLRPQSLDGNWGEWSSWVECSRTCGGGVESRKRDCVNPAPENGGKYCIGAKVQYNLCNFEPCDQEFPRFREVQCAEFNRVPYKGENYNWVPVPPPDSDPNPCALYCMNDDQVIAKLRSRVTDGTRCRAGSKDTCIQGSCVPVGCDWKIGSDAIEDICGECGGDGTHCGVFKFVFTERGLKGCEKLTVIPRNSKNIDIKLLGATRNKLAICDTNNGMVYFNDQLGTVPPGEYVFGGAHGVFTKPENNREEIHIKGPLKEDITIMLCFKDPENPGVQVMYAFPTYAPTHVPKYHWEFIEWGQCSARCGTGTQISKPSCVEERGGKVMDEFCRNLPDKPEPRSRTCNMHKCRARWKAWNWGPCSGCLYKTGRRTRRVECIMENPKYGDGDEIILNESECPGPPPKKFELCNTANPCKSEKRNFKQKELEEIGYYNYCYNTKGLEKQLESDFQKLNAKRGASKVSPGNVVKDERYADEIALLIASLTVSNIDLNLTEEYFEEEGDYVPSYIPEQIREYRGRDALKKLSDLTESEVQTSKPVGLVNLTKLPPKARRKESFRSFLPTPSVGSPTTTAGSAYRQHFLDEIYAKRASTKQPLTKI